ncbi:MAG TPA: hypothetical protein VFI24_12910 [Pyrinomonadaceae bacterium]|nr:hypothetical protein [Pyrinomonadaceae bacterium]
MRAVSQAILLIVVSCFSVAAQDIQVKGDKHKTAIPQACESIVPANLEDTVDVSALVKELSCKGSGDMVSDYSYVLESVKRERGNKGQVKEEIIVYEVFMPTLPNGTRGRGVLLVTSRDGVPVPPAELEKKRLQAGERLEKEEKRLASVSVSQTQPVGDRSGMLPLGSYGRFLFGGDKAVIDVHTFLANCELNVSRREQNEGREMLILTFRPRPGALFKDSEKYIAQLTGEMWIDVKDRIVTRLVGWPQTATQSNQKTPAVYYEMIHLPTGIWLPLVTRINGTDYPGLFDHITAYSTLTFSEYKRFSTEVKDQSLDPPR